MMETTQRIIRLTPLDDVLDRIDAVVRPVEPRGVALVDAIGLTLAADVKADAARPSAAIALRDGWAVRSDLTLDAGSYAPALLPDAPARVDIGHALPPGTDAVALLDAVVPGPVGAEALAPVGPGEGVLAAGADVDDMALLATAGTRVTATRSAVLAAAGVARVQVRRPRVLLFAPGEPDTMIDAAVHVTARAIAARGGDVVARRGKELADALRDDSVDTVLSFGGTGVGCKDTSVDTLRRLGRVEVHGVALSPGESVAFGLVDERPILLVPGRLDAALAVWLTIGRRLMGRLAACSEDDGAINAELSRKVSSGLGMAELVPVRCRGAVAEPVASGYLPLHALAAADGWILVPPDSEGYPVGTFVAVRPWP